MCGGGAFRGNASLIRTRILVWGAASGCAALKQYVRGANETITGSTEKQIFSTREESLCRLNLSNKT